MKKTLTHGVAATLAVCLSAQSQAAVSAKDDVSVMELPQTTAFTLRPRSNDNCDCVVDGFNGYTMEPTVRTQTDKGGWISKLDTNGRGDIYYYTPPANANPEGGSDSFTYKLTNDAGSSATAKYHIIFTPKTAKPQGVTDSYTAISGVETRFAVNANDIADNIIENTANRWSQKSGTVKFGTGDNKDLLIYKSKPGFTGLDKVWYTLRNRGGTGWAEVRINVVANNNGPAKGILDAATTRRAVSKTINVLGNDIGNGLVLNPPNPWTLQAGKVSLSNNKIVYTPNANHIGQDKFWYSFTDAQGRSSWSEARVEVTADANTPYPRGRTDQAKAVTGKTIAIDVLKNDFGSNLTLGIPNAYSQKGGLVGSFIDGNILYYQSKAGFTGTDKVWYTLRDDRGRQNWAGVTINVTAN